MRRISIQPPLGGLDRSASFQMQAPFTTPDCLNVWPHEPSSGRRMLSRRPGLVAANEFPANGSCRAVKTIDVPPLAPTQFAEAVYTPNFLNMEAGALKAPFVPVNGTLLPNQGANTTNGELVGMPRVAPSRGIVFEPQSFDTDSSPATPQYPGAQISRLPRFDGAKPWTLKTAFTWNHDSTTGSTNGRFGIIFGNDPTSLNSGGALDVDSGTHIVEALIVHAIDSAANVTVRRRVGTSGSPTTIETYIRDSLDVVTMEVSWDGSAVSVRFNGDLAGTFTPGSALTGQYAIGVYGHGGVVSDGSAAIVGDVTIYVPTFDLTYTQSDPRSSWTTPSFRRCLAAVNGSSVNVATDGGTTDGLNGTQSPSGSLQSSSGATSIASFGGLGFIPDSASGNGVVQTDKDVRIDAAGTLNTSDITLPTMTGRIVVLEQPRGEAVIGAYEIDSGTTLKDYPGGEGTVDVRVVSPPKFYNPYTNSVEMLVPDVYPLNTDLPRSSKGIVPYTGKYAVTFMGRLVLADDQAWYASRSGDPFDWDYAAGGDDVGRAIASGIGAANQPESGIIGLHLHTDDNLLIMLRGGIYVMRGDPALGAGVQVVSDSIGPVGPHAWCSTPTGETVFRARDGIYMIPPGGAVQVVPISESKLPIDLYDSSTDDEHTHMYYDYREGGVVVFVGGTPDAYFIDWETKSMWPFTLGTSAGQKATAAYSYEALISSASKDYFALANNAKRTFDRTSSTEEVASYAVIGPISMNGEDGEGVIQSVQGVVGADSDDGGVPFLVVPSVTKEASCDLDARAESTWEAVRTASPDSFKGSWRPYSTGLNPKNLIRARGHAFSIVMGSDSTSLPPWSVERAHVVIEPSGRLRFDG